MKSMRLIIIFLQLVMANFFIQTDKDFYFAGDTVNGNIFVNVGAMIVGAQGLSLKFTGYECVKWLEARELHRPSPNHRRRPNEPPPYDPIAAIPPHLICNTDNMTISDCESQGNTEKDHRPRYIRTSANRYFEMKYFQTRNMFTRQKTMIYNCSGFPPGQYSFPFSFKTFEGWPASFNYRTPQKKGIIIYHMTAAIEPMTPKFKLMGTREVILRETRVVQSQQQKSAGEIKSCCCISKGLTSSTMSFEKDGYQPGELVQMIIEIDNTACTANVNTISITVNNQVTLRSQGHATSDSRQFFHKQINGIQAGQALLGDKAIREQFMMPNTPEIKPTCSGKLLSSQYSLNIKLNHDIMCECCSNIIGSGIPIIIFPLIPVYAMPAVFQSNWTPQIMPQTVLVLPNNFANFNLSAMQAPPPPPPPPMMPPPQMQGPPPPMMPPPQMQGPPPPQMQGPPPPQMGMNMNMGGPPQGPPPGQMNMNVNMNQGGYPQQGPPGQMNMSMNMSQGPPGQMGNPNMGNPNMGNPNMGNPNMGNPNMNMSMNNSMNGMNGPPPGYNQGMGMSMNEGGPNGY